MRVISVVSALFFFTMVGSAQAPAPAKPAPAKPAAPAAARVTAKVQGNLAQVMRGILFPNSNIIFDAQNNDPTKKKEDPQFGNPYAGWQSVENAAIALAEASNLLIIPGRMCSNGKPAPNNQPDWPKLVQGLLQAFYFDGISRSCKIAIPIVTHFEFFCNRSLFYRCSTEHTA